MDTLTFTALLHCRRGEIARSTPCGLLLETLRSLKLRNKITEAAESVGLPTFVVADAGRTQVAAGSRTVLAVGPGPKELVDWLYSDAGAFSCRSSYGIFISPG